MGTKLSYDTCYFRRKKKTLSPEDIKQNENKQNENKQGVRNGL